MSETPGGLTGRFGTTSSPGRDLVARRVGAYVLDVLLLFAVLAPLGWLTQWVVGFTPSTGGEIWLTLLLGFSLPSWGYFTLSDMSLGGATLGKRRLGVRVSRFDGSLVHPAQALGRTAVKLLPWELIHLAAFGLAQGPGLSLAQTAGLGLANALIFVYLACVVATRGGRSVHDIVARTVVRAAT